MPRTILHIDLDAFYCAVEETRQPALRGRAFAVGGKPEERGVVASCSYAARRMGVRSAMPMGKAVRLCPGLIIVPSRHNLYSEVSRQVMERLHGLTSLVEQISIDEAFLDISDIHEPPETTAQKLQSRIRDELQLPCSIGIASNKMVAKIATEVGKSLALREIKEKSEAKPPNALTVVPLGEEAAFLSLLPADMLWGVGPKTSARLTELGIYTIGDMAKWPESELVRMFGENGRDLARHSKGIDDRPVVTEHETKSISQEITYSRDVREDSVLYKTLHEMSIEVGKQLRRNNLAGKTVKLKLRWPDFTTLTRQTTLTNPTDQDEEIERAALELLKAVRKPFQAVRLIGVGVTGLGQPIRQLGLWDTDSEKERNLQNAVDELREKYGKNIIQHGDSS
ncbi:MAG TPA: DNA polymerase IV [Anaerolineales bacterium]|jgi:DNA polymerase-4|nr:DNA polymerase IV [Anaerolineales bacterium]